MSSILDQRLAWIDQQLDNERRKKMAESPQITLGELIRQLEAVERPEAQLFFSFGGCFPTKLASWRGAYSELAVGFSYLDHAWEDSPPTVASFLATLRAAVGATFTGYKGGDYIMTESTPVWVADYDAAGNTGVVGIIDKGDTVYIETRFCEYL